MATLTVRKTTAQDYPAVLDFYTRMIDEMAGTDFDVLWKKWASSTSWPRCPPTTATASPAS